MGNFFSCSSETSCSFFPTIFYKSLKIFFPDPSPTAHLTLHTHLSLTIAHLKNIIPVISNHGNSYTLFTTNLPWSIFTHVASIYANLLEQRKRLNKKRVQLPQDCLGTPAWPPFHCFGTPIWPLWRHVKTLHWKNQLATTTSRKTGPSWLSQRPLGLLLVTEKRIGHWLTGASLVTIPETIAGHISVLVSYRL